MCEERRAARAIAHCSSENTQHLCQTGLQIILSSPQVNPCWTSLVGDRLSYACCRAKKTCGGRSTSALDVNYYIDLDFSTTDVLSATTIKDRLVSWKPSSMLN